MEMPCQVLDHLHDHLPKMNGTKQVRNLETKKDCMGQPLQNTKYNRITMSQTNVTVSFMSTPFNSYIPPDRSAYATPTSTPRGRGGGARRGRRPKAAVAAITESTKSPLSQEVAGPSTPTTLTWQSTMVPAPPTNGSGSGSGSGGMLSLPGATAMSSIVSSTAPAPLAPTDEDGEDELLPAMADDDYSAQLSWQSQSKDNLKCVEVIYLMFGYLL